MKAMPNPTFRLDEIWKCLFKQLHVAVVSFLPYAAESNRFLDSTVPALQVQTIRIPAGGAHARDFGKALSDLVWGVEAHGKLPDSGSIQDSQAFRFMKR